MYGRGAQPGVKISAKSGEGMQMASKGEGVSGEKQEPCKAASLQ